MGIYLNNPNRIDVNDCTCDEFYELFRQISKKNTETYESVFNAIPTDAATTFAELKNYSTRMSVRDSDPYTVCILLIIKK